jgi:hypothetical protein
MGKIIKKTTKEVNEVIGYECDICGNDCGEDPFYSHNISYIKYSTPSGGWGEGTADYKRYVCSKECLLKSLKNIPFNCKIQLGGSVLKEFQK